MGGNARAMMRSEIFAFVARCCMVLASSALPLIGTGIAWYGKRIIEQGDQIRADLAELKTQELLSSQKIDFVKMAGEAERRALSVASGDHEMRLRYLEGGEARAMPPRRN